MTAEHCATYQLYYLIKDGRGRLRVTGLSKRPRGYKDKTFPTHAQAQEEIELRVEKERKK